MENAGVALADLIEAVRADLERAMRAGQSHELRFRLGPVELDLGVVVTQEAGGGFSLKVPWVPIGGEASGHRSGERSQRVHVVLNPPDASTEIADDQRS
jgi:hypothetical protein